MINWQETEKSLEGKCEVVDLWAFTKAEDNPSDLRKYMAKFFTQKFFQMKIVNSVF